MVEKIRLKRIERAMFFADQIKYGQSGRKVVTQSYRVFIRQPVHKFYDIWRSYFVLRRTNERATNLKK